MVIFVGRTATAFTRYLEDLSLANLSAFGAGALVVVRSMTAGGGYLGQVEWAAFGVLVAVAMAAANSSRTVEADQKLSPLLRRLYYSNVSLFMIVRGRAAGVHSLRDTSEWTHPTSPPHPVRPPHPGHPACSSPQIIDSPVRQEGDGAFIAGVEHHSG